MWSDKEAIMTSSGRRTKVPCKKTRGKEPVALIHTVKSFRFMLI
uniref:Uncharacterized protein n=1 Tax=Anguilla anguilla TaxID=7936 RepID=A0A0E9SAD0_ANGAN